MGKRRKARELALQALYQYEMAGMELAEILQFSWQHKKLPEEVYDFANSLISGTIDHLEELDQWISNLIPHWNLNKLNLIDKNIIRFSLFCLKYRDDIPQKVIIDEAVELGKIYGDNKSFQFINGVLDNAIDVKKHKIKIKRKSPLHNEKEMDT